jgi:cyclopropane fatty-acyl-phospholipid synthase-like methyltransferase
MSGPEYVLGSTPQELQRLVLQARMIQPTTSRLLRDAGIEVGSRVLDLGCGSGDVSILAAQMVGPTGSVVAIDRAPEAIELARARARDLGLDQIEFCISSAEDFHDAQPFDMAVGRYVLIHQVAPAVFLGLAQRHVRAGGALAFHEIACHRPFRSLPAAPIWDRMVGLLGMAAQAGFPSHDAAGRFVEHFDDAGLPQPHVFAETIMGGGMCVELFKWFAETMRSVTPGLVRAALATEAEISADTLADRLREEAIALRAQVELPMQVCAWARV